MSTKVCLVKAMVFPVDMYGCESWTIKRAECRRIEAFELWHWRRLLRVPWTAKRSNQSILRGIGPGYSLKGLMSKLFNMLCRLVITFLPRNKHLLISWLQSPSAVILEPPQNKVSHCFYCFPIYLT